MRRSPRTIDAFRNVRWSTSDTLDDCVAGLSGLRIAFADTLRDTDDLSDLRVLRPLAGRLVLPVLEA